MEAKDLMSWIHVPQGYAARYDENNVSNNLDCIGICTTQFTSCWPIIIIHYPTNHNDIVRASLIHLGDSLSIDAIKHEIKSFIKDNYYVFIYRQSAFSNVWYTQHNKYLIAMEAKENPNYTLIDLPSAQMQGFVGFRFDDMTKIRNIPNHKITEFIKTNMILLPIPKRDKSIHENPLFLKRHPQEFQIQLKKVISDRTFSKTIASVIFNGNHWVNINDSVKFTKNELNYMNKLKKETDPLKQLEITKNYFNQNNIRCSDATDSGQQLIVSVLLYFNNFDIFALFNKHIKYFKSMISMMLHSDRDVKDYLIYEGYYKDSFNGRYYTKKGVEQSVDELSKIFSDSENWASQSKTIRDIADFLLPFQQLQGFMQICSFVLLYITHFKMEAMKKSAVLNSVQGKKTFQQTNYQKAIDYFSKSLKLTQICYTDPSLQLIQAYYNLGSAYYKNNNCKMSKYYLSIANDIICDHESMAVNNLVSEKSIKMLSTKIKGQLQDAIITLALSEFDECS